MANSLNWANPVSGDVTPYISLITSQHADKPNYVSMLEVTCQPLSDIGALLATVPTIYDLDVAVGTQLDTLGLIVGVDRTILTPLTGVYFSLDTQGLGFDEGVFQGPLDPSTGIVVLPDDAYRILLRARIANNHWDGSKQHAYDLFNSVLNPLGYQLFLVDRSDLTIDIGLLPLLNLVQVVESTSNSVVTGTPSNVVASINPAGVPDVLTQALLTNGDLDIKPATIRVAAYIWPSAPGQMFAFDTFNSYFAGFDVGIFATFNYTGVPNSGPQKFALDLNNDVYAGFDIGVW